MRRAGGLWPDVVSFAALERAARRAARQKRGRFAVARFLTDLEPEVLRLQRALVEGTWTPSPPRVFEIHDPKRRTIAAPPFPDRVVHHALIGALEPVFERRMVDTSFACRRGKGTHAALDCAQRQVRRYAYAAKLDVRRFFPSLPHDVVLGTIARCVKDRRVLALCERIVRTPGSDHGLPIGALTSQWFANLVLDRLDHHAKETLGIPGYVRYMDDVVCFGDSSQELRRGVVAIGRFLGDELGLALKETATRLAPTHTGVPFLGWSLYPGLRRIRRANLRRLRQRLRHAAWEERTGRRTRASFEAAVRAVCSHLATGDTLALRRGWFGAARAP